MTKKTLFLTWVLTIFWLTFDVASAYCPLGGSNNFGYFSYGFCSPSSSCSSSQLCEVDFCDDNCHGPGYQGYCVGEEYCGEYPACWEWDCA